MSGTVRGIIDCRTPVQQWQFTCKDLFKVWNDYFINHPLATRVAMRRRAGAVGASKTDFWDAGANSWADGVITNGSWDKCYGVYRMNPSGSRSWPYYVMILMHDINASPGHVIDANAPTNTQSAVSISVAIGVGGDENPWNGTTNADGSDALPTQFWKIPTGGTEVITFPMSNSTGNTHATNRNNFMRVATPGTNSNTRGATRHSIMGDDDTFVIMVDDADVGIMDAVLWFTTYTPRYGITASRPAVLLKSAYGVPLDNQQFADSSGSQVSGGGGSYNGGIAAPDSNLTLASPRPSLAGYTMIGTSLSSTAQPNYYTGKREVWPITLRTFGSGVGDNSNAGGSLLGYIDPTVIGVVSGVNNYDLTVDRKTIFVGDQLPTGIQCGYPFWDPGTLPRTTMTRNGVTFSRAP